VKSERQQRRHPSADYKSDFPPSLGKLVFLFSQQSTTSRVHPLKKTVDTEL
jgi:hypothetical protein